jgi:RNA polymerase sigma-70 factor (ECF subfamily)
MTNNQLSKLIHSVADGDMEALKDIWHEMQMGVTSFALMYLKNHQLAEDATQETFEKIIKNAGSYTRDSNPKAWILTITRNIAISMTRKYAREVEFSEDLSFISDSSNMEYNISDCDYIISLLNRISVVERKILVLHVVSGLKHHEISKLLEMPLGTVYRTYSQCVKKLRKY